MNCYCSIKLFPIKFSEEGIKYGYALFLFIPSCSAIRDICNQVQLKVRIDGAFSFVDWWAARGCTLTKEKLQQVAMLYWEVCNRRNQWVWNRKSISDSHVIISASQLLKLWEDLQVHPSPVQEKATSPDKVTWCSPMPGYLKCNGDCALFEDQGRIGMGMVQGSKTRPSPSRIV